MNSTRDINEAAADIIAKIVVKRAGDWPDKEMAEGFGYFDKEHYEYLMFNTKTQKFVYAEGDPLCIVHDKVIEFENEAEFKSFLKQNHWFSTNGGKLKVKGVDDSVRYWLEGNGFKSLEDYIEKQN